MIKKYLLPLLLLFILLATPTHAFSQEGISRKKQEKTLAKDAKKEKKAKAKQEKHDRKRHLSLQDKAARKRIKRNTKGQIAVVAVNTVMGSFAAPSAGSSAP